MAAQVEGSQHYTSAVTFGVFHYAVAGAVCAPTHLVPTNVAVSQTVPCGTASGWQRC